MLETLAGLFRSRKFLLALAGVIMTLLGHYAGLPGEVLASIDALLLAVIAGIAVEDHGEKSRTSNIYHYSTDTEVFTDEYEDEDETE